MFFENKKEEVVNLDHVYFIKKEFLFKEKKYVILFQFNTGIGYMTWKYETEKERNDEYEEIKNWMFSAKIVAH